jgi:NADP-dependent 3-hydroxy acid dehydrogenase YdfG
MTHQIALITGASSGIGEACAKVLAQNNYNIIACGRNREKLLALQKELSAITKVHVLVFDVKNRADVWRQIESLDSEWNQIDVLINSAGNAHGKAALHEDDMDNWDEMIDANVKGLLYVSKAVMPQMMKRKRGYIVNLSSIAGKEVYAGGAVYCASKAAVESISQAMRLELVDYGIRVCNIAPGVVETNFSMVRFKGDKAKSDAVYSGWDTLKAKDIADTIMYVLNAPSHVQLADILILPKQQASATVRAK